MTSTVFHAPVVPSTIATFPLSPPAAAHAPSRVIATARQCPSANGFATAARVKRATGPDTLTQPSRVRFTPNSQRIVFESTRRSSIEATRSFVRPRARSTPEPSIPSSTPCWSPGSTRRATPRSPRSSPRKPASMPSGRAGSGFRRSRPYRTPISSPSPRPATRCSGASPARPSRRAFSAA